MRRRAESHSPGPETRDARRVAARAAVWTAVLLWLAWLLALPAAARPPHPRDEGSAGEAIARHAERLGLDDETRAQIGRIVREADARRDALEAERQQVRAALRGLLEDEAPAEAVVLEQVERLGSIETEAHKNRLRAMVRIRALLTPEQRAELVRIREEQWAERSPGALGRWRRCTQDLERHCTGTRGPDALRCLAAHWDALAPHCREGLERLVGPPSEHAADE